MPNNSGVPITDAYLSLMALRQVGYRSTATAVAELVDNSIESNAKNISIVIESRDVVVNTRASNHTSRIMVLDDGEGMPDDILKSCLGLGWGTRLETREGLGRFGFGLKGSTVSQSRRGEVYSWTNGLDSVRMTYLDMDEIKHNSSVFLPEPVKTKLPELILKHFKNKIGQSGTLVVWNNLDQLSYKTPRALVSHFDSELCRVFRHFLDADDDYGDQRYVTVYEIHDTDGIKEKKELQANDPLYLLTPNNVPGYENEATNEPHGNVVKFSVPFVFNGNESTSDVEVRFSIAKPSIQKLGGSSQVGKHYAVNQGISFVRAGREIDFGGFGYLSSSDPRDRWWGAEVRFNPVLDEFFGVNSNKQEVRNIKKYDEYRLSDFARLAADENDGKAILLTTLQKVLEENISKMMDVIKSRGTGERRKKLLKPVLELVNDDVKPDKNRTESGLHGGVMSNEDKVKERVKSILDDDTTLTESQALEIAKETIDYRVDLKTAAWPGNLFIEREIAGSTSVGIINRSTDFYTKFWEYLEKQKDPQGINALEILLLAFIRAEDEIVVRHDRNIFKEFRQMWGGWVERLIRHADSH